jgi:hypothetical protein
VGVQPHFLGGTAYERGHTFDFGQVGIYSENRHSNTIPLSLVYELFAQAHGYREPRNVSGIWSSASENKLRPALVKPALLRDPTI